MWKKMYDKLRSKGLNPSAPGQHVGECREKYCVIRESAQVPYFYTNRLGYRIIDIIVYVPLASYVQVEPYMNDIRAAMKELPFLRKTGTETPIITDDEAKAYTASIEYQIIKKLEG